jgi:hypothetical protein
MKVNLTKPAYYTLVTCANGWQDWTHCYSLVQAKKWANQRQTYQGGSITLEYGAEVWKKELIKYNDNTFKWGRWLKVA